MCSFSTKERPSGLGSLFNILIIALFNNFCFLSPFVLPISCLILCIRIPLCTVPAALYLIYCLKDGSEHENGKPWGWFTENFFLFKIMRNYFPISMHLDDKLQPGFMTGEEQLIFAIHPHGTCSDYRIFMDGMLHKTFPKLRSWRTLAAGVLFKLPLVRELALWTHCVDASRPVAMKQLDNGHSIFVVPGGEHEQLLTENGKEILYLRKRKGFVRLAIISGASLVPVYVFGASDLYHTSNVLFGLRFWLMKTLQICIPIFWGRFGMLCPLNKPLDMVFGEPISVERNPKPSKEEISKVHEIYIKKLEELFEERKKDFGYGDRKLQIL
mmetsp:Transcript_21684/g.35854  ORF Transcript_21684/g.35854 Transcript_21684/m.35854 type:complete len:327 (+) Transcript_21684:3-983(+)